MKNAKQVVENILKLQGCKTPYKEGHYSLVLCPCHDDHNPSLEVSINKNRIIVYCHAGCPTKNVIQYFRDAEIWPEGEGKAKLLATYTYKDRKGGKLFKILKYGDGNYYSKHYEAKESGAGV